MRTLVIGYGVVGRGIHDVVRRDDLKGYTFGFDSAPRMPGFLPLYLPTDVDLTLGFDRVIWASRHAPLDEFLSRYHGDLVLVSSKAVTEPTDYGISCLLRERKCLEARHLRSLRIWRLGYPFGPCEDEGRLLERIKDGTARPSDDVLEPLPAMHVAEVIVGQIAGPKLTVSEVIDAMARYKGVLQ